jgi:hypothetical protein
MALHEGIKFLLPIEFNALGFTQSLTEVSTGNIKIIMFLGTKVWWVCRADNFTAIFEPTVYTMWDP